MEQLPKKNILGIAVTDAKSDDILQYITRSLEDTVESYYIVTPNPEMIVFAGKSPSFKKILNQAQIALPDGIGVTIAARILGKGVRERVSGTDLMESLCAKVAKKPITVGFLGGKDRVAEKTVECLLRKYPGLNVVFIAEEWGDEGFRNMQAISNVKSQIPNSVDILFVAFGFPKQEEWMANHLGKIPVRIMMGVGGAFDYLSGKVPRAPFFLRAIGLEWLFRLFVQPWRWRRQLSLISFFMIAGKEFLIRSKEV
ncbi:MAG: hypothetical protein RLZZ455_636 [Candidatus Parcubacteria bacterium]|jgi:N-acetylglucosaminyldiphosphoundecaprenol N-acetyl-beta-D-mannosaminyltransferase